MSCHVLAYYIFQPFFCRAGQREASKQMKACTWLACSSLTKTFSSSRLLLGNEKEKAPQLAPLQDPQQTLALTKYRTLPPFYKHVPYHHNHRVLDQRTMELREAHR